MIDLCIFGSPRKNHNTMKLVNAIKSDIEKINLVDKRVKPCRGCLACYKDGHCIIKDDFDEIIKKVEMADRLVIASPVYFNSVSGILKNFIDRLQSQYAKKVILGQEIKGKDIFIVMSAGSNLSDDIKKSIEVQLNLVVKVLGGKEPNCFFMENLDNVSFDNQISNWKQKNDIIFKLFSIS
ncbi:MAG: flavodoxin family protein [Firmicutes bacterium]|jgi:multimeric flavodoxin WrbA|nr:flavodoxin family protein [Bacillota bacterium]